MARKILRNDQWERLLPQKEVAALFPEATILERSGI